MTKSTNDANAADQMLARALRELPSVAPDDIAVARWSRAASAAAVPKRSLWREALPMALAATLVLAFVAVRYVASPVALEPTASLPPSPIPSRSESRDRGELPTYVAQAALLEQALARMPSEGRVRSVSQASAIVSLEDRLALIANTIENPSGAVTRDSQEQLWRERVGVMATLVNLKQADDSNVWL